MSNFGSKLHNGNHETSESTTLQRLCMESFKVIIVRAVGNVVKS